MFHARVYYWSGDPLGYVDALSRILRWCKERAREEGRVVVQRREVSKVSESLVGDGAGTRQSETASGDEDEDKSEGREQVQEESKQGPGGSEGKREVQEQEQKRQEDEEVSSGEEGEEGEEDSDEDENGDEDEDGDKDEDGDGDGDEDDGEESEKNEVHDEEELDEVLAAAKANLTMWLERVARVCLILVSQMIEMNVGTPSLCVVLVRSSRLLTRWLPCWTLGLPGGDQLARSAVHTLHWTHFPPRAYSRTPLRPCTGLSPLWKPPKSKRTLFYRRIRCGAKRQRHRHDRYEHRSAGRCVWRLVACRGSTRKDSRYTSRACHGECPCSDVLRRGSVLIRIPLSAAFFFVSCAHL